MHGATKRFKGDFLFIQRGVFCCNISRLKEPVLSTPGTGIMVPYRLGNDQFIMQTCSTDMLALPINMAIVDGLLYTYSYIVPFKCILQSHFSLSAAYFNTTSCLLANNSHLGK